MAAKKKESDTGLHGYPITRFQGPGGDTDVVDVSSAIQEHNLRAAGYVPAKGHTAPAEEDLADLAETVPVAHPAPTTTNTTR